MDNTCDFCKILYAKTNAQFYVTAEDKENGFLAFLDIAPFEEGHTIVIPVKHYLSVWDIPNIEAFFVFAKKIKNKLLSVRKDHVVHSTMFSDRVQHAHLSLIPVPRYRNHEFREKYIKLLTYPPTMMGPAKARSDSDKYKVA